MLLSNTLLQIRSFKPDCAQIKTLIIYSRKCEYLASRYFNKRRDDRPLNSKIRHAVKELIRCNCSRMISNDQSLFATLPIELQSATKSVQRHGNNINFGATPGTDATWRETAPIILAIIVIATIALPPVLTPVRCSPETKGENTNESIAARAPPIGPSHAADPVVSARVLYHRVNCPVRRYNVYCLLTIHSRYLVSRTAPSPASWELICMYTLYVVIKLIYSIGCRVNTCPVLRRM